MNKKNKVLLSTVGLLLLSGVAATSSTFAWFTTVRSATINYSDATASTKSGNLNIAYVSSENTLSNTPEAGDNVVTITGVNKVTDISGDGATFYKPVWASQTSASVGTASFINTVAAAEGFYIDFTVTVSRDNALAEEGLKVYLGAGTKFTDKNGTGADIVPTLRLAVLNASAVVLRWAPEAEADAKYLVSGAPDVENSTYGLNTHKFTAETASTLKTGDITTATTQTAADALGFMVADLSTSTAISANITFRAWIEGTDAQTVNAVVGEAFSLAIDLYALAPNA